MSFNDFMKGFETDTKKHKRNQYSQVINTEKRFVDQNENLRMPKVSGKHTKNLSVVSVEELAPIKRRSSYLNTN